MNFWTVKCTLIAMTVFLAAVPAQADIRVTAVEGSVQADRGSDSVRAAADMVLADQTALSSADGCNLTFCAPETFIVKTVPCPVCKRNSTEIQTASSTKTAIKLNHGGLLINIAKLPAESSFEVATPLAITGVRGTRFWVHVHHEGDETIAVREGAVDVVKSTGQQISVIAAGLATDISKTDATSRLRGCADEENATIDSLAAVPSA